MKRIIFTSLLAVLMVLIFSPVAFAVDENDFVEQQYETSGARDLIGDLPKETQDILDSMGVDKVDFSQLYNVSFTRLLEMFKNIVLGELENPLKFLVVMVGVLMLISIAQTIVPQDKNKALELVCALFFIIATMSSMISYASYITSAIDISCKFMLGFIPVFTAAISVSGNPAAAISYNTVAMAIAQSASGFTNVFIVPIVIMFVALSIAASVSPELNMDGILEMFKKTIIWLLTAICTVFTGFLSLKGILVSSADTVAVKSGKALIGALVPIIGDTLSESYSSILGSMSMLKNAVGVFGIIAVSLINIPVLIQALMWIVSIYFSAFAAETMGQKNCAQLLKNINSTNIILVAILVFNIVLIMVSTALVMLFKSTI